MKRKTLITGIAGLIAGAVVGWFAINPLVSLYFFGTLGEKKNGWVYFLNLGRNEPPSIDAAAGVKHGMFGHLAEEAVYFVGQGDASGGQSYALHFDKDEFPPVGAFWSLTMYHDELPYNLVDNEIDRYVISDRTDGIKRNEDGSLDIYIQHENPGADKMSNWLPAPDSPFRTILRAYIPGEEILDGSYAPPAMKPVNN